MAAEDILQFLDEEKAKLFSEVEMFETLYQTLSESLATLTVPFRDIFGSDIAEAVSQGESHTSIQIAKHALQSAEGQIQDNIVWLRQLTDNIQVIQHHLRDSAALDLSRLKSIDAVHNDVRDFLQQLYSLQRSVASRDKHSQMPQLAQKKKKDIESLLSEQLEPYIRRLIQLFRDRYSADLRIGLKEDQKNLATFSGSQKELELFVRSKCEDLQIPFEKKIIDQTLKTLNDDDEILIETLQNRYKEPPESWEIRESRIRDGLVRVVNRYFARSADLAKLGPILKSVHKLFQPKPSFLTRMALFLARLFGKPVEQPSVDVSYTFITAGKKIERRRASLETVMARTNELEKSLLRGGSRLNTFRSQNQLGSYPVDDLKALIQDIQRDLKQVYEDCFGLVQWIGRSQNESRLEAMSETLQHELNSLLYTINATLIINNERQTEISTKHGIQF